MQTGHETKRVSLLWQMGWDVKLEEIDLSNKVTLGNAIKKPDGAITSVDVFDKRRQLGYQ